MSNLQFKHYIGAALHQHLDAVACLRMEVFRDYPYLYDGTLEYEQRYLQTYIKCEQAVVVLAFDGAEVVGASTGIPLAFEEDNFKAPFVEHGYDPSRIFYCAESVLRSPYRGRGAGVRFFAEREKHARKLGGFNWYAFCAVERPVHHPLRPPGYQPLDTFWTRRGYTKHPELGAMYHWKDIDQPEQTSKRLEFWLKSVTCDTSQE
jgi:GNAT superfamily N-acetyltransferase